MGKVVKAERPKYESRRMWAEKREALQADRPSSFDDDIDTASHAREREAR